MSCKKCNFSACSCSGIQIALFVAVVIGVLFFFGLIPFIFVAAWIALSIAVLALIVLIVVVILAAVTASTALTKCLCGNTVCLLIGIIGTIILTIAALSIFLYPYSIAIAVLVGIATFFFTLMIIALIALILCIICRMCGRDRDAA